MAIRAIATDSQDFNNPSTTGKPGRDERLDFKNEAGDTVFSIVSDADGTASIQGDAVPKVYRALLTQSDTNAPTATVLENTLGENPTFSYENTGVYAATFLSPLLLEDKTSSWMGVAGDGIDITKLYNVYRAGNTALFIRSYNGGTPADNLLTDSYVEILVYP
jgi:hypothetical protein